MKSLKYFFHSYEKIFGNFPRIKLKTQMQRITRNINNIGIPMNITDIMRNFLINRKCFF